jgi:hypothetical protein
MIPALTRERVVSEACQSSIVVTGRFTFTARGSATVPLQVNVVSDTTVDRKFPLGVAICWYFVPVTARTDRRDQLDAV